MGHMSDEEVRKESIKARQEAKDALDALEKVAPGITEGAAGLAGAALGAAIGVGGVYAAGTVTGLSAAGISSGLAAAGALVGGGMAAGLAVMAAPAAILGIAAYDLVKSRKNAKIAAALKTAISKLYSIQERLMKNAEYFKSELAEIRTYLDLLENKKKKYDA